MGGLHCQMTIVLLDKRLSLSYRVDFPNQMVFKLRGLKLISECFTFQLHFKDLFSDW